MGRHMTWLIQSGEGDPVPRFYSAKVARNLGSSLGWTERRSDATPFDTEKAAEEFTARRMGLTRVHIVEDRHG